MIESAPRPRNIFERRRITEVPIDGGKGDDDRLLRRRRVRGGEVLLKCGELNGGDGLIETWKEHLILGMKMRGMVD